MPGPCRARAAVAMAGDGVGDGHVELGLDQLLEGGWFSGHLARA